MDIDSAIRSRRSVRGFLDADVPAPVIAEILETAARAPSGTNMQPWRCYVVRGARKQALTEAVLAARESGEPLVPQYKYYPSSFREPYLSRRRRVGLDLYGLLGIGRDDSEGMLRQANRNYDFFGAPVGLMFTIDSDLEMGSWLDYGIFLGTVMIAARGKGLHTCPQAAWINYHRIIRSVLGIGENQAIVCGMALGYEDPHAVANRLATSREPVDRWVSFLDDGNGSAIKGKIDGTTERS
ncbi:MAG: nitroreductase [Reyranellaceae bacterium]